LLLDEPTNDLDASAIQGLITILKESLAGALIISHDQDFLNKVTNKIFEIDNHKITQYS
jgi:ATP-binding cassette subfamily F protein 3